METRRRPLTYVVIIVVALALIGWLVARSVAKQRLLRALGSNDLPMRVEAARKLLEAEKLVDALPAQPVIRRSKAAQALGEIGTEEAIAALAVILEDQEEAPKRWAREALVKIGKRSIPTFMRALAVGGGTKDEAVKGLVELGMGENPKDPAKVAQAQAEVAAHIRFLLSERSAYKGAAEALPQLGKAGVQALVDGCYTVDKDLRKQCLNNLGKQGIKAAVPAALFNLKPGGAAATGNAIAALGLIGDRSVTPQVIPFLAKKDDRLGAATALGLLRDPRAVDPLLDTLTATEKAYRDTAILALRRIGVPALPALMRELKSPEVLLRRAAASGMIGIGSPVPNSALAQGLNDSDEEVRVSAALALGWKGNVAAVGSLVQALSDPKWRVVDAAVQGLGEIGTDAINPLLAVLSRLEQGVAARSGGGANIGFADDYAVSRRPERGVEVGYQVSRALAEMGRPAVPSLMAALQTASPGAQKWVAVALGEIGDPRAVEPLRDLEARSTGDLKWVAQEQLRVLSGVSGS